MANSESTASANEALTPLPDDRRAFVWHDHLSLWFSLATHGTDAYRAAVDTCLTNARDFTEAVLSAPHLELFAPTTLSIVTFTRPGWERTDYQRWSDSHLAAGDFFIAVSEFRGQPLLRVCLVHPNTTRADLQHVIDSLA